MTYRLCGHSRSDPRTYRTKEEEAAWQARDPVPAFAAYLRDEEVANPEELLAIEARVEQLIADAIAFADASPTPDPQDLYQDVYAGD